LYKEANRLARPSSASQAVFSGVNLQTMQSYQHTERKYVIMKRLLRWFVGNDLHVAILVLQDHSGLRRYIIIPRTPSSMAFNSLMRTYDVYLN
jgi:hypothetical protein